MAIFTGDLRDKVCAARLADHAIPLPTLSYGGAVVIERQCRIVRTGVKWFQQHPSVQSGGRLCSAADVSPLAQALNVPARPVDQLMGRTSRCPTPLCRAAVLEKCRGVDGKGDSGIAAGGLSGSSPSSCFPKREARVDVGINERS
ncbi:hypothetical protein BV898_12025 [Hypsibius exemplaris]|uniref:Uncharacterized protein n=1 Tax=Hypsibius exemplaris TaxID=2072580 RepID=A0A1W0WF20_HYPEX|nr:hypothetical protein BV898_12025 [Hypsibius exemplaris]